MRKVVITATLGALFVVLTGLSCGGGSKDFLLFVSRRDGNHEIYRMNYNGTGQTNLSNNAARDYNPSLRRDRQKIAFASDRSGAHEVWVMNVDGSNAQQLTFNAGLGQNYHPAWSPDGTKIAYIDNSETADGGFVPYDIAVINADGSGYVNLTNRPAFDLHPAWSPDGTKIAFSSNQSGTYNIWIMDADGSNPTQLTFETIGCYRPSFTPSGRIVFWADGTLDGGARTLHIMDQDGSNRTQIDVGSADNWAPAVSRNGLRLVFASTRDGNREIYSSRMDGSDVRNLSNNAGDDHDPVTSVGR